MHIYTSPHPDPPLPRSSLWTYLFPPEPAASPLPPAVTSSTGPALVDGLDGRTLRRSELRDAAAALSGSLGRLGVKPGETACVFGLNGIEWVVAALGCVRSGVVVSPANYAYTPSELAHQLADSAASLVFVQPALLPVLERALPLLARPIPRARIFTLSQRTDGPYAALGSLASGAPGPPGPPVAPHDARPSDVAFLCYSSGTTGLPKGVQTTHGNLTSQLQAFNVAYQPLSPARADAVLGVLPFAHIYGLTVVVLQPLTVAVPVVVLPRWDEPASLRAIEKHRITHGLVVPPMLLAMVHSPNVPKHDLSSLRSCQSGAAPLGADLCAAFERRVPGCKVTQGYGLTETSPVVTVMTAAESAGREGTIGRLIPTYQARLVDVDTREDVAPGSGAAGELWVRGPSVMKGYHNDAAATAQVMADGGWYKTGDVAVRDADGYYTIVDRVKELIKYKGYQVPPAELEALLLSHPSVVDAGVIGVPSAARATELPRAYVVLAPALDDAARAAAPAEIARWVAARVARHKRLAGGVRVVSAVPKSPSGKILRKELRAMAKAEAEAERAEGGTGGKGGRAEAGERQAKL